MTWPLFHRIQFYLLQRLPWINLEFNKFLKCITCTGKLQFPLPTPVSLSLCRCYLSSICSYIIQYINWSAGGLKSNIQKSWPIYVTRQTRHVSPYISILAKEGDVTPTWFEHAAFWSGVRRATVAPRSHYIQLFKKSWQVLPRFELGSLDSKSRVLTITP